MASELDELLANLRGQSYPLFCALQKSGSFDNEQVRTWCRLLAPRARRNVKKRLILFLLEQRYGHSRRHFLKAWRRCSAIQRQNILRLYCRRHLGAKVHSMYWLLMEVLKSGVPSKKDFLYIWRPVKGRFRERMKLCWYAYLQEGCNVVHVLKSGQEAVLELRLTRDPTSPSFCF